MNEMNSPISWGFDGIMILAAIGLEMPIAIETIEAETARNRARQKISQQISAALQLCRAASRAFPETIG